MSSKSQGDFTFKYSRPDCERIVGTPSLRDFSSIPKIYGAYHSYSNGTLTKRIPFARAQHKHYRERAVPSPEGNAE